MIQIPGVSQETSTRMVTGVVGGALLLTLLLLLGHVGVMFAAAIIGGGICHEMAKLIYKLPDKKEKTLILLGTAWLFIFVNTLLPKTMVECLFVATIGLFTYYLISAERNALELKAHFEELVYTIFTLVYVVSFICFLPLIRQGGNGVSWLVLFLLIVWAGDTGAYFAGKKWGKNKLYPLISPGKSLEGSGGGLVASILVTLVAKLTFFSSLGWVGVFFVPLFIGISSQIGDLCESFLKRAFGIKDSGNILPGHGGMLDRFDGVLFSLPVAYFCIKVFG